VSEGVEVKGKYVQTKKRKRRGKGGKKKGVKKV